MVVPIKTQVERNAISEAIWALRNSAGLSQHEFARRLGISVATLARYEKNWEPSIRSLTALAGFAHERGVPKIASIFENHIEKVNRALSPSLAEALQPTPDRLREIQDPKNIDELQTGFTNFLITYEGLRSYIHDTWGIASWETGLRTLKTIADGLLTRGHEEVAEIGYRNPSEIENELRELAAETEKPVE